MPSDPRLRRPLVTVTGLSKTYGRVVALDDVAFSIRRGEILGLIGPNGAGKTTLFECLAEVQPADRGQVALSDADGTPTRLPRWGPRHDTARRADVLFYLPDGIAPWPDQPVEWALQFMLHFLGGRADLYGGSPYAPELASAALGHLLNGGLTIALAAAAHRS